MVHLKCKSQTSAQKDPKNKKSPEGRFNGILTVDFFEAQSNSEWRFNECKIWPCQMIGWKECKRGSAPIKGGPSGFIELDCRENESNVRMVLPKTNVISLSEANEDNSGVSFVCGADPVLAGECFCYVFTQRLLYMDMLQWAAFLILCFKWVIERTINKFFQVTCFNTIKPSSNSKTKRNRNTNN